VAVDHRRGEGGRHPLCDGLVEDGHAPHHLPEEMSDLAVVGIPDVVEVVKDAGSPVSMPER
jgi:hypothetical protein